MQDLQIQKADGSGMFTGAIFHYLFRMNRFCGRLRQLVYIILVILFIGACHKQKETNMQLKQTEQSQTNLITLSNDRVSVTIAPGLGGRIVAFSFKGKPNVLKSDSNYWDYRFKVPVEERIYNQILPLQGHIVWLGPQSQWWTKQDIKKDLKKKASRWPPDPYLIYSTFEIVQQEADFVHLKGPESVYSGVQLEKKIRLLEDNRLSFMVEAENIRREAISWDLWLNTRMDGFCRVYVPVEKKTDVRLQYRNNTEFESMPYTIENGYFHFLTRKPSKRNKIDGKAFLYPAGSQIFAFTKNEVLIIHFDRYDRKKVHPEQGLIEIYNSVTQNGDALMELEYHTPYTTLQPGEKMQGNEIWELVEYNGTSDFHAQRRFMDRYLHNEK